VTAIWLLSTRGRPEAAQACIDACTKTGMTSPGVVYIDETVDEYRGLKLPPNWTAHYEPVWLSLQGSMQWCFDNYPDATAYGWLADDTRPRTKGWDKKLEKAAGDWNLAYAKDLWLSEIPGEVEQLMKGNNLSAGLCWGGDLVRTVGWWALPGVRQAGIDTAWTAIVKPLHLHRYITNVTVEHLHWRTGKREWDAGDDWVRDGVAYIQQDVVRRNQWVGSVEYRNTLRRLGLTIGDPGHVRAELDHAMRESYANQLFMTSGGLPASRLKRIMEGEVDFDALDSISANTNQGQAGVDRAGGGVGAGADVQ
jgi:hypothetical protein